MCVYIDAFASSLSNFTKHGLSKLFREYVIIVVNTAIGYALVALLLLLQVYKSNTTCEMLSSLHIKSQENSRRLLCLALSEQLGIWMRVGEKIQKSLH